MWLYVLKSKSEVVSKFISFYNMVLTQFKTPIQTLRSDNGREFLNQTMREFCESKGIVHQTTCPNTPQQNGVTERKNRILLEITRTLMFEAHVPAYYWPEAVTTAAYLINRLPTRILQFQSPLQYLAERITAPDFLTLPPRVFGTTVFVHIPKAH